MANAQPTMASCMTAPVVSTLIAIVNVLPTVCLVMGEAVSIIPEERQSRIAGGECQTRCRRESRGLIFLSLFIFIFLNSQGGR